MSSISSAPFSSEEIAAESLKHEEYEEIVKELESYPNKAEFEMCSIMQLEDCYYQTCALC